MASPFLTLLVQGDSALVASTLLLGPDLLLFRSTAALANTHEGHGNIGHGNIRLLFQRMLSVASRLVDNVEDIFIYEQYAYPAALLDARGFLREANKPHLADAIWVVARGDETPVFCEDEPASMTCVLDGG